MSYDIVVVGGGLLGAGIARDAALRGLSVCVFEQEDFGAGATSRGNRLATGGLNALETLDFTRVREDIHERELLLQNAPHLVSPQPCLIPFYTPSLLTQTRLRAGLALTDALGFDQSLPVHQLLSPAEARAREPSLRAEGLTGAALVWEASIPHIERLALETALDTRRHGGCLRTHTRVDELCWQPEPRGRQRAAGVRWSDRLTGERGQTDALLVVAAVGAWPLGFDALLESRSRKQMGRIKSVSVIGPPLPGSGDALVFPREEGRHLLVVCPRPNGTWVGSVETDFEGDLDTVYASGQEVSPLTHLVHDFLPGVAWDDLISVQAVVDLPPAPHAFSFGVTPPNYDIADDGANGGLRDGLLTVWGGRVAGARAIAEEVVDLACRKLGRALSAPPCRTASLPLPVSNMPALNTSAFNEAHLRAAVEWAVAEEECRTLRDFIERRTPLFTTADQGRSAVPVVLEAMTALLGWDRDRQVREVKAFEADVALTQAFRVI